MKPVLFSPHSDDETLFAFYTAMRHKPRIVICFPSERDYGDTIARMHESRAAMSLIGIDDVVQWQHTRGFKDVLYAMLEYDARYRPESVWAPDLRTSHPHHRAVAQAASEAFESRLQTFHTYDEHGKVTDGVQVPHEPEWAALKLDALACYRTQIEHPRARVFFNWPIDEYAGVGA